MPSADLTASFLMSRPLSNSDGALSPPRAAAVLNNHGLFSPENFSALKSAHFAPIDPLQDSLTKRAGSVFGSNPSEVASPFTDSAVVAFSVGSPSSTAYLAALSDADTASVTSSASGGSRPSSPFRELRDLRFAGSAFFNSPTAFNIPNPVAAAAALGPRFLSLDDDSDIAGRTRSSSAPPARVPVVAEEIVDPFRSPPRKQQRKSRSAGSRRTLDLSAPGRPSYPSADMRAASMPVLPSESSQLRDVLSDAAAPRGKNGELLVMTTQLKDLLGLRL
eukprot:TRINITY_DN2986_c0_g2_i1.p1 TRINITY_DN2986_c0_g2~~TRINITY_DN2986_c0_g2_i1.p1  ORF type:complete len:277 (-),score=52.79 TRINITY_DN2986_c0_g2_i1:1932-2762(-)